MKFVDVFTIPHASKLEQMKWPCQKAHDVRGKLIMHLILGSYRGCMAWRNQNGVVQSWWRGDIRNILQLHSIGQSNKSYEQSQVVVGLIGWKSM